MNEIKVEKVKLLETLKANREKHIAEFAEAFENFKIEYEKKCLELKEKAKNFKPGEPVEVNLMITVPRDYKEDYDTAISMLEWEVADEIVLDQEQFTRYVLDKWQWKMNFDATTAFYNAPARRR